MVDAKSEYDWQHTSHLLWMQAELNRDRKRTPKAYKPDDFMPRVKRKPRVDKSQLPEANFSILKDLFVKDGNTRYGCTWSGN